MTERKLTVSFGGSHPAKIVKVRQLTWSQFGSWLTRVPPEAADKAERGWYCPVEFDPAYRDSDNFVARHALTLDFDHVEPGTWEKIVSLWDKLAFAMYTTFSHTEEKPRFRVVIPLSRPAGYDEFQAVSRKVTESIGIELAARESHKPAQMMYAPTRRAEGAHRQHLNQGVFLDVDSVLAEYADWTDVSQWPKCEARDGVHLARESQIPPDEKPGLVGEFCRTFTCQEAIEKFDLPYEPTANPDRWTYTEGSRPEGVIIYDSGLKLHSHHDTDPARGQSNAFDLVRIHRFGNLDHPEDANLPMAERPSFRAMVQFAQELPELQAHVVEQQFVDLGPSTKTIGESKEVVERFRVQSAEEFSAGKPMEWIVRGVLPRAELCVIYGESGSGKSFLALDLCAAVTRGVDWRGQRTVPGRVVYVCAEGAGGFKARLRAYAQGHDCEMQVLPAVVPDAPNLLEAKDVAALAHSILSWGQPDVVVIDTLSATTPGGNENSGEDMGRVISHCKFIHQKTGALVCCVHHSGKDSTKGARGWSGLRAAADAEIEITRTDDLRVATVTKMKDGMDGTRLAFKLNVVALGYDPEGEEESSCIVRHVEDVPPPQATSKKPKPVGAVQIITYELLKRMAAGGSTGLKDLEDEVIAELPQPDGRDERKRFFWRALTGLVSRKLAYIKGNRVSLTNVVEGEEEWLS